MTRRPFFVGIGAQRSGTTWLAHYLRALPDVQFSPLKEVDFFTSLLEGRPKIITQKFQTRLAALGLGRYAIRHPVSATRLAYHYLGMRRLHTASYQAYFNELGRRGQVAGEISPSYAGLPPETIAQMDEVLNRPNYFYVIRNPVDRLVSQMSFRKARRGVSPLIEGRDLNETLEILADCNQYSAYSDCLKRYGQVIEPARFRVIFFERLFNPSMSQEACDSLCEFLSIKSRPVHLDREVNRAPPVQVDTEVRQHLVRLFAHEYEHIAETFPKTLPEAWQRDIDACLRKGLQRSMPSSTAHPK